MILSSGKITSDLSLSGITSEYTSRHSSFELPPRCRFSQKRVTFLGIGDPKGSPEKKIKTKKKKKPTSGRLFQSLGVRDIGRAIIHGVGETV